MCVILMPDNKNCPVIHITLFNEGQYGEYINTKYLERVRSDSMNKEHKINVVGDELPFTNIRLEIENSQLNQVKLSLFFVELLGRPMVVTNKK